MIRLAPLPFQQQQEKTQSQQRRRNTSSCLCIVVGFLLCLVVSVLSEGPHCNQVGHGPEDIIMATGRINSKYSWYKRGHKTYVPLVMDPTYSHKEHSTIVGGLNEIQEKTCVEFEFYEDEHSLQGKDYVYITRQTKRGCWSYIGRIGRGKQEIGLPPGCITHRTAMHEMMHALGFRHEHVRHDRDDYIMIFWGNIRPGRESNFQRRSNDISVGPYDYNSIMHYERKAFSVNNMDTIRPVKNGVKIGVRQKMSHWDAKKINIMYGCHAGGGGGGHLSWSPEHDHEHDDDDLIDDSLSSVHPALPRNASSSPLASSEIEVAYDELDYDPALNPSSGSGRGLGPQQRLGSPYSSFQDEFIGSGHHPGGSERHGQRHDHYDDNRQHPHSGHDSDHNHHEDPPNHYQPRINNEHQPNNDYPHNSNHHPQSYSHFELDTYPNTENQGSDEGSPDNVDFYDT